MSKRPTPPGFLNGLWKICEVTDDLRADVYLGDGEDDLSTCHVCLEAIGQLAAFFVTGCPRAGRKKVALCRDCGEAEHTRRSTELQRLWVECGGVLEQSPEAATVAGDEQ